jgi:hypothetical protein
MPYRHKCQCCRPHQATTHLLLPCCRVVQQLLLQLAMLLLQVLQLLLESLPARPQLCDFCARGIPCCRGKLQLALQVLRPLR